MNRIGDFCIFMQENSFMTMIFFVYMNLGANIAVYAAICKHLNLPFTFPGERKAYGRQVFWDASDADLIAEHLIWEATTKEAANQVNYIFSFLNLFCA